MNPFGQLILTAIYSVKTWTPLQWLGLALVLAAYLVPRLVAMEASALDALETAYLIGAALLAGRPTATTTTASVMTIEPPPKGGKP